MAQHGRECGQVGLAVGLAVGGEVPGPAERTAGAAAVLGDLFVVDRLDGRVEEPNRFPTGHFASSRKTARRRRMVLRAASI